MEKSIIVYFKMRGRVLCHCIENSFYTVMVLFRILTNRCNHIWKNQDKISRFVL